MFLILEIASGIVLAVVILARWREIGAVALVVIGGCLLIVAASSITWGDLAAFLAFAGVAGALLWLDRKKEAAAWDRSARTIRPVASSLGMGGAAEVHRSLSPTSLRHLRRN